jgi:hypothetical protein
VWFAYTPDRKGEHPKEHLSRLTGPADDGHDNLAMLVLREGETSGELLTRFDLAIAKARTEDIFTDEINPPSKQSRHS